MTIFILVGTYDEFENQVITAFKHDPTSDEIKEALIAHVRKFLYDDSEEQPVFNTKEILDEVEQFEEVCAFPLELID